jgi:hypothetical protein
VSDGDYYLLVDAGRQKILWKRLIEQNDVSRVPALRFALNDRYLAVVKEDYDLKAIEMLSSRTGEMLWRTDHKDARSPRPLYEMRLAGDRLFGLGIHPAQDFYFICLDARTGRRLFRKEVHDYVGQPEVTLMERPCGPHWIARVRDRQDFELRVLEAVTGNNTVAIRVTGAGDFGEYGRASVTVQDGALALLGDNTLKLSGKP